MDLCDFGLKKKIHLNPFPSRNSSWWEGVFVGVSLTVIKCHDQKQHRGGKGLLQLITLKSRSVPEESRSRNIEAGTEVEATEDCCSLTYSSAACSACFRTQLGTICQRWHRPQWTGPSHTTPCVVFKDTFDNLVRNCSADVTVGQS